MKAARILLAAGASGSGKTLITCGLLQALVNRGLKTASFKCGPDYIDPMFHSRVIGVCYRYACDSDRKQQRYECFSCSICERLYGIQEGQSYTGCDL